VSELVADIRGSGPPVVLLHGQPGAAADWQPVIERLQAEFTVIVPDRPGYGRTGGRARGFRANAAAVQLLLDRLQIPSATVVGHSWAGGVAIALAEEAPTRVKGMVLVASVAPGSPVSRFDRVLAVPPVGEAFTALTLRVGSRALTFRPFRQVINRRLRGASHESLIAMVEAWRDQQVWRSFVTEQRSLIYELPRLAPGMTSIQTPTEVVVGDADRIVPAATSQHLVESIPGATLVRLPGTGHLIPHQHPESIVESVRRVSAR
jgi:pimeloyl-ACP methyl ester carboxylesterase